MKYYQMTQCINHPNNKAETYTGHVHKGRAMVDAGWCDKCSGGLYAAFISTYSKTKCEYKGQGCYGKWKKEYGIEEYTI